MWLRQWSTGSPQYTWEIAVRLTVIAAIFLVRKRISANARSTLAACLLLMVGTGSLLRAGPTAYAPFYLTMGVTVLGLCFGMRAWARGCVGVSLGMAAMAAAITREWIQPTYVVPGFLRTPMEFGVVALLVVVNDALPPAQASPESSRREAVARRRPNRTRQVLERSRREGC